MKSPYKNLTSCKNTIAHFRECREYGCWKGRDTKLNCVDSSCKYHPRNPREMKNECELGNGVIWRKNHPNGEYDLGQNYLEVIKSELLSNRKIPIRLFLSAFYPEKEYKESLIGEFKKDFNLTEKEINTIFELPAQSRSFDSS